MPDSDALPECEGVACVDVKGSNSGTELSVQRFLGYTAIVNFNNYLNSIQTALLDSGTLSSLLDGKIVTVRQILTRFSQHC